MTRSRVLIVEDDRIVAMNLETIVHNAMDADVLSVRTVGEARALIGPDLHFAFLERHVTAAHSFDLASALRASGVPVAFMSPCDASEPEIVADRLFIRKPFRPDQVRQVLRAR